MTQWHADVDAAKLSTGAKLTVVSQHHVVRVITADTLSIETPNGQRLSAVVLDRTESGIKLILKDGTPVSLGMLVDESLLPPGESPAVFSRQVWLAN
jgi:hypothetical protein